MARRQPRCESPGSPQLMLTHGLYGFFVTLGQRTANVANGEKKWNSILKGSASNDANGMADLQNENAEGFL